MAGEQKTSMLTCLIIYLYKYGSHGFHHCSEVIFTFSEVCFALLFSSLHKPFPSSFSLNNLTSIFTEEKKSEGYVLTFHHHVYTNGPHLSCSHRLTSCYKDGAACSNHPSALLVNHSPSLRPFQAHFSFKYIFFLSVLPSLLFLY